MKREIDFWWEENVSEEKEGRKAPFSAASPWDLAVRCARLRTIRCGTLLSEWRISRRARKRSDCSAGPTRIRWGVRLLSMLAGFLLFPGISFAAPVGPIEPVAGRWDLGLEAGAMTERRIDLGPFGNSGLSAWYKNKYFFLRAGYGVTDSLEIYARLGGGAVTGQATLGGLAVKMHGKSAPALGLGIRGTFLRKDRFSLDADLTGLVQKGNEFKEMMGITFDWYEWHAAIAGKMDLGIIKPYVGARYSDFRARYLLNDFLFWEDRPETKLGVFGGLGFDFTNDFGAYLEGRFLDETAFGGGVRYRF